MDCAVSAQKPQIHTANPVSHRGTRTVRHTEHVSIPAHVRPDITLPEFNQKTLLFPPQRLPDSGHKHVQRLLDIPVVHTSPPHGSFLSHIELIDEIQFQSIQIPFPDSFYIDCQ